MTYAVVFCLIFMMVEFPNQLKIFSFFSPFCRALFETIKDSSQILLTLLIVVFFQMFTLWVLDANSDDPAYGVGVDGFWPAFIDSYRMSVGDFEVIGTFEGKESALFWTIFMIGNLVSLLIILNMVIAVMASTFERVQEDVDSYINKLKVENLLEYAHRLSPSIMDSLSASKYLVLVQVNPDLDRIQDESSESRIRDDIKALETRVSQID